MKTARIALPLFGGCFFLGMWAAFHLLAADLIAFAVFGAAALFFRKNASLGMPLVAVSLAFLLSGVVGGATVHRSEKILLAYGEKELTVTAKVSDVFLEEENRCGILLKQCTMPGGEKATAVVYGFGDFTCEEGETVSVKAAVQAYLPTDSQRGRGADFVGNLISLERLEKPAFPQNIINNLYKYLKINIKSNISGPESDLFGAILLGERENIPAELEDNFRLSGISHLLCISGLHLILLAGLLRLLLYPLFGRLPWREIPVMLLIFAYLCCIGFPPAACRAALLLFFSTVGKLFYRKGDSLMILSLSVVLMLLTAPWLSNSISFQLSVASVAGLELLEPKLRAILFSDEAMGRRFSFLTVSLSASAAVFPWSALVFGYFSLGGVLASAFTVPLMTPMLAFGLGAALFTGPLGELCGSICRILLLLIEAVAETFSFCLLPLRDGFVLVGILFAAVIFLTGILLRQKEKAACFAALFFALSLFVSTAYRQSHFLLAQFHGENSAVVSISRGRSAVVVGMGNGMEEEITGFLRSRGIDRVECLILPDDSRNGSGDTWDFVQKNEVSLLMAEKSNRYASQAAEQTEFFELKSGYFRVFGEDFEIREGKHGFLLRFLTEEVTITLAPEDWAAPHGDVQVIIYDD